MKNKMTTQDLKNYIISEAKKLHKIEVLKEGRMLSEWEEEMRSSDYDSGWPEELTLDGDDAKQFGFAWQNPDFRFFLSKNGYTGKFKSNEQAMDLSKKFTEYKAKEREKNNSAPKEDLGKGNSTYLSRYYAPSLKWINSIWSKSKEFKDKESSYYGISPNWAENGIYFQKEDNVFYYHSDILDKLMKGNKWDYSKAKDFMKYWLVNYLKLNNYDLQPLNTGDRSYEAPEFIQENKMTTKDLKNYIISEAKKLHKIEVLKEDKKRIDKELKMLSESIMTPNDKQNFEKYSKDLEALIKYNSDTYSEYSMATGGGMHDGHEFDGVFESIRNRVKEILTKWKMVDNTFSQMDPELKNKLVGKNSIGDWNSFGGWIKNEWKLGDLTESSQYDDEFDDFEADGFYTVSNAGGYEIMISDDGQKAKVRDAFGSDHPKTSGWLKIEYDADENPNPIIDPNGYDIPLNRVFRIRK